MDLKVYFQKARDVEDMIEGNYAVVVSCETAEGGRAGQMTEVAKNVAARLVVDNKARLATPDETREFYDKLRREREELMRDEMDERGTWPPVPPSEKPKRKQPKKEDE